MGRARNWNAVRIAPLLPHKQQEPRPSKEALRSQAAAAVTAWIEKNGKKSTGRGEGLAEPVRVAEFWKNRQGESIRATLVCYEGRNCFDLRQHFTAGDGKLLPTKKGITIAVLRLPDLAAAVNKALVRARELGLIEAEKTGGAA
jgi:hypothetical protein